MAKIHSTMILLVVFVLGIAGGIGAAIWAGPALQKRLHKGPPPLYKQFQTSLNLTPEQTQQVRAIIKDTSDQSQKIRAQFAPLYRQINDEYNNTRQQERDLDTPIRAQGRQRIRALLTPAQQAIWDKMIAQQDKDHQQHMQHGPGRGPGRGPGFGMNSGRGGPNHGNGGPPPGSGHLFQY